MADNDAGYGKPPKHTQFKKGQSGNPKGRPRKGKSPIDRIRRIFDEPITIYEDGKARTVTKGEAMIRRLVADSINGKIGAQKLAKEFYLTVNKKEPGEAHSPQEQEEFDKLLVAMVNAHEPAKS